MDENAIKVWRFEDAPDEYKNLSTNGGDEDWLALVPASLREAWVPWMDSSGFDSMREPQRIALSDGRLVVIGSHA